MLPSNQKKMAQQHSQPIKDLVPIGSQVKQLQKNTTPPLTSTDLFGYGLVVLVIATGAFLVWSSMQAQDDNQPLRDIPLGDVCNKLVTEKNTLWCTYPKGNIDCCHALVKCLDFMGQRIDCAISCLKNAEPLRFNSTEELSSWWKTNGNTNGVYNDEHSGKPFFSYKL